MLFRSLRDAKPALGVWDVRNGPGRLMDIELGAQTLALLAASPERGVEAQIVAGHEAGSASTMPESDAQALLSGYRLMWRLHAAIRLLTDGVFDFGSAGEGARAFVLRETGMDNEGALAEALDRARRAVDGAVTRLVGAATEGERGDGSG